jgi:hypothetical protein
MFHPMNADSDYESSECPELSSDEEALDAEPHAESHAPLCSCSSMWKPWLITSVSFVDGPERNLLQLAAALQLAVDDLRYELDGLGLDPGKPADLFKFAQSRGSAVYLYRGHRLYQWDQPTERRTDHPLSIVASVYSGRLYLYAMPPGLPPRTPRSTPEPRSVLKRRIPV